MSQDSISDIIFYLVCVSSRQNVFLETPSLAGTTTKAIELFGSINNVAFRLLGAHHLMLGRNKKLSHGCVPTMKLSHGEKNISSYLWYGVNEIYQRYDNITGSTEMFANLCDLYMFLNSIPHLKLFHRKQKPVTTKSGLFWSWGPIFSQNCIQSVNSNNN